MYDTPHFGRPFRALNVIDDSNREALAIEINISLPAARVVRTLEEIHGLPQAIRLENWSEHYALPSLWVGANLKALNRSLYNPANPQKMPLLNPLIKPTATKYSMPIYLKTSERYVKLQKTGSRFTTKKDQIFPKAESALETTEHRHKTTL